MSTKRRQTVGPIRARVNAPISPLPANVVDLRMRVLPRHLETMDRWLEAGRAMGLCDAAPFYPDDQDPGASEYVLVWVRENADPAYKVAPEGMHWTLTDTIRNQMLARVRTFEEALTLIRPVLPAATS
jgi:hypothetical protein